MYEYYTIVQKSHSNHWLVLNIDGYAYINGLNAGEKSNRCAHEAQKDANDGEYEAEAFLIQVLQMEEAALPRPLKQ